MRSWSKGDYPSWHIRRDNASAFCGRALPLGTDTDSPDPPNEERTCETCFRREREQRPPQEVSSDSPNT